jgi:hypothetical protein
MTWHRGVTDRKQAIPPYQCASCGSCGGAARSSCTRGNGPAKSWSAGTAGGLSPLSDLTTSPLSARSSSVEPRILMRTCFATCSLTSAAAVSVGTSRAACRSPAGSPPFRISARASSQGVTRLGERERWILAEYEPPLQPRCRYRTVHSFRPLGSTWRMSSRVAITHFNRRRPGLKSAHLLIGRKGSLVRIQSPRPFRGHRSHIGHSPIFRSWRGLQGRKTCRRTPSVRTVVKRNLSKLKRRGNSSDAISRLDADRGVLRERRLGMVDDGHGSAPLAIDIQVVTATSAGRRFDSSSPRRGRR